jgi:arsenate reductase
MAEGLLRHFGGTEFTAYSAGLDPERQVHPLAVQVMEEIGIDISRQEPKGVGTYLGRKSINIIITVCNKAEESCPRLWPGVTERNRLYWPLEDPLSAPGNLDEKTTVFRKTRDNLLKRIKEFLN